MGELEATVYHPRCLLPTTRDHLGHHGHQPHLLRTLPPGWPGRHHHLCRDGRGRDPGAVGHDRGTASAPAHTQPSAKTAWEVDPVFLLALLLLPTGEGMIE